MDADHVSRLDQVGRADLVGAEAQVRDGASAGLLRVEHEVPLDVLVGTVTDDLDRVLVGTDGAVRAEAEEHRGDRGVRHGEVVVGLEREVRDVIHDADGETALRLFPAQLGEDAGHHARRELLARQTVTAADDGRQRAAAVEHHAVHQGGGHVQVQRLGRGPRLLAAVEDGEVLGARRQCGQEGLDRERTVQPDVEETDLLAGGDQGVDGLAHGTGARAHDDDDPLCVRGSVVVNEAVLAPGVPGELVHHLCHDPGHGVVVGVAGFAALEEDVGVLGGTARGWGVRGEPAQPVLQHQLVRKHGAHDVLADDVDLVDLVRGAEPVEEVHERDARTHRGGVGDECEVLRLLHRRRAEHRPAGHPGAHHVGVVAEDRQRVGGQGAGGDVDHARRQLARDLVHVGEHQEQALGRREGRAEGALLNRAVQRSGSTGLGLHLDHLGDRPPQVRASGSRPGVGVLAHGRGRSDGVDRDHFAAGMSNHGSRFVAVNARP